MTLPFGRSAEDLFRVLFYVLDPDRERWLEHELAGGRIRVHIARTLDDVLSALIFASPPRPPLLFVDFDAMTTDEVAHLHAVREHGWVGRVIAFGTVPVTLRLSMRVERVLQGPFPRETVRAIVTHASQQQAT